MKYLFCFLLGVAVTIVFSNWGLWQCENPFNLPTSWVKFKEETLNKTYAKFICTVEDSANKGISKGYAEELPRMLVPGKYTFEWRNKGLFTDYYVAKMTSLGERFLKDFKAKAEKDGFQIEYKLMYSNCVDSMDMSKVVFDLLFFVFCIY